MQVEAIARATAQAEKEGLKHDVRIMIPNVTTANELKQIRAQAEAVIAKVNEAKKTSLKFQIGSMIEFPRAAATSDKIAEYADEVSIYADENAPTDNINENGGDEQADDEFSSEDIDKTVDEILGNSIDSPNDHENNDDTVI